VVVSALMGFVIMGLGPILFQHGAEVAYPVQEGASFGTIMMAGQITGILFVLLFDIIAGGGALLWSMLFLVLLAVLQIPFAAGMKESQIFLKNRENG